MASGDAMKKLLLLFLVPSLLLAETPLTDPYKATKGYLLPQDSWVFSEDKAKEIRDKLIDLDFANRKVKDLELLNSTKDSIFKLQEDKVNIVQAQNDKLSEALVEERSKSQWSYVLWFGMGVAATVLTAFAVSRATR